MTPFLKPDIIADRILEMLEDTRLSQRLRRAARAWAEANLDMATYLKAYEALIQRTLGSTP
jgi:glycosyltransferase involved in cell wall biosynthesis